MTSEFTLLAQGFFIYPYTAGSGSVCPLIAVPFCEGHKFILAIAPNRKAASNSKNWRVRVVETGTFELSIQGLDKAGMPLTPAAASAKSGAFNAKGEPRSGPENFNLLPDAKHQTPGVVLREDWQNDLRAQLDLHGGSITAVPDNTTFAKVWQITKRSRRILSNLVRYTSQLRSGSLRLNGEAFPLTSESVVVMFHIVPAPVQGRAYGRGIDHNASILKLCQERDVFRVSMLKAYRNRRVKKSDRLVDFAKLVAPARKAVGLSNRASVLDPGTPSCSGRKIAMP